MRPTNCPICGRRIPLATVRLTGSFPCPNCGEGLRLSKSWQRKQAGFGLVLAIAAAYLSSDTAATMFLVAVLLSLPVAFIVGVVVPRVMGFTIEPVAHTGWLHLGDSDE